ncbi:MAG TPA: MoaD/ThiS family protein [Burkholderiales bacterium]|nr:MoaD/ThiS family protein [Burkholderiales bacterium]
MQGICKVYVPSPLSSYTGEATTVEAAGDSVAEVLADLDRTYPGIRRIINEQDEIRRHIKIFVNRDRITDLAVPLTMADEVMIVCALSGG